MTTGVDPNPEVSNPIVPLPAGGSTNLWSRHHYNGRTMIARLSLLALLLCLCATAQKPNVLFIAVDDLNDWVGCLGGHPQAKTPNIDGLAERGVLFTNAHTAAPLCNPSRTAILFGRRPSTTGVVGNMDDWRTFDSLKGVDSLPQYFRKSGYYTAAGGKIFHANHGGWKGALTHEEGAPYAGRGGFGQPEAWDDRFPRKDDPATNGTCPDRQPPQRHQSPLGLGSNRFQGRRHRRWPNLALGDAPASHET